MLPTLCLTLSDSAWAGAGGSRRRRDRTSKEDPTRPFWPAFCVGASASQGWCACCAGSCTSTSSSASQSCVRCVKCTACRCSWLRQSSRSPSRSPTPQAGRQRSAAAPPRCRQTAFCGWPIFRTRPQQFELGHVLYSCDHCWRSGAAVRRTKSVSRPPSPIPQPRRSHSWTRPSR